MVLGDPVPHPSSHIGLPPPELFITIYKKRSCRRRGYVPYVQLLIGIKEQLPGQVVCDSALTALVKYPSGFESHT